MPINMKDLEMKLNAANMAPAPTTAAPTTSAGIDTAGIQAITTDDNTKATPQINADHIDSLGIGILMLNDLLLTASERILAIEDYINRKEVQAPTDETPVPTVAPVTTPVVK